MFLSDVVGLGQDLHVGLAGATTRRAVPRHRSAASPRSETTPAHGQRVRAISGTGKLISSRSESSTHLLSATSRNTRTSSSTSLTASGLRRHTSYEMLAQICRGKRVILVSATPLNNTPRDILSQVKLFQNGKNSTIPNVRNLEAFFSRAREEPERVGSAAGPGTVFRRPFRRTPRQTREKVLKYLMIRRTRTEIMKYYGDGLAARD